MSDAKRGSTSVAPPPQLIPFLPGPDARRVGGAWPGWRRALREVIGDGEALFRRLDDLAHGVAQLARGPDGDPIQVAWKDPISGLTSMQPLLIPVPPAVQRAAASELLDRAFGKPVQVVLDLTPDGDGEGTYVPAGELTAAESAIVRQIAKRRMLVQRVTEE